MRYLLIICCAIVLLGCSKDTLNNNMSSGDPSNGTGGSLARFTLAGNYLYVVENANLKTFDVTNPADPFLKSTVQVGFGIETIYPYKDKLFIGSQMGMFIYSITNPADPAYEGSAMHVRSCDPVVANDTAAFVTLRGSGFCGAARDGLYVYDVRNLLNPTLVQTVDLVSPYGLGLKNSTLFVCLGTNGLAVMDVSNTRTVSVIRTITGHDFRDVIPFSDVLICYINDGIALYDISDTNNITFIKKLLN